MSRRIALAKLAALAAMAFGGGAVGAPLTAGDAEKVRAVIGAAEGAAAPGCAFGLFEKGGVSFVAAGSADVAARRAPDADTLFYAGSLAKQFTALAVVQLVVAGKLRLDDDVRRYLPEMAKPSRPITVAMLLHHTAGVPNSARLAPLAGYARPSQPTRAETLALVLAYPRTDFPPGATFAYSNGGYELLAEIVERVSKTPFEDYVEGRILKPLGMTRSRILRGAWPKDENIARGYVPKDGGFAVSEDIPLFGGAGGLLLTINDLDRYHHDIAVGHRVWTPEVARLMTEGARYADDSPVILPVTGYHFGYASGLMLSRDWVLHGGNFAGFQALVAWLPGRDEGLALLCNRGDLQPPKLATRILAAVRPGLPPVDAERYALAPPDGRFASDDLPVVYRLVAAGDDLEATASAPSGEIRSTATFKRTGDGAYADGATSLVFDQDRRGFVLSNGANAARFHRAP